MPRRFFARAMGQGKCAGLRARVLQNARTGFKIEIAI